MYLLITYDISSDKKRRKVEKLLSKNGERVNKSVFECEIKKHKFTSLTEELEEYLGKEDSIRIYRIDIFTIKNSIELNKKLKNPFEKEDSYV